MESTWRKAWNGWYFMYNHGTTSHVCALEDKDVSKTELYSVYSFCRRLKEAVGEQNFRAVSLAWHKWEQVTLIQIMTHQTALKQELTVEERKAG